MAKKVLISDVILSISYSKTF